MFGYMNQQNYESTLNNNYRASGNIKAIDKLEHLSLDMIKDSVSLYDAQDKIKGIVVEHYGAEWYESNGAAVQHIVENEYANDERATQPYFDKKFLECSLDSTIMW